MNQNGNSGEMKCLEINNSNKINYFFNLGIYGAVSIKHGLRLEPINVTCSI